MLDSQLCTQHSATYTVRVILHEVQMILTAMGLSDNGQCMCQFILCSLIILSTEPRLRQATDTRTGDMLNVICVYISEVSTGLTLSFNESCQKVLRLLRKFIITRITLPYSEATQIPSQRWTPAESQSSLQMFDYSTLQVLWAMNMKVEIWRSDSGGVPVVIWVVTPFGLVGRYQGFEEIYFLHLIGIYINFTWLHYPEDQHR
jgi:hypothetical protein